MADTKKVIRMLNNTLRHCHNLYNHVTSEEQTWLAEINQGAKEALELLKEQPDVVRCGDCRHYKNGFCYNPNSFDDEKTCGNTVPDWFCADGERRNQDEDES